ncbi:MAG TPA: hypothetical protein VM074_03155 [Solimonas sp.]|nr:hypothetical protein [Solimonas sp.]
MHISTMEVEEVVLSIFRELCIPAGGRLSHAMLIKEWAHTPLRADDLAAGIKRLERLRAVATVQTPDGVVVILTGTGHERAASQKARLRNPWRLSLSLRRLVASFGRQEPADAAQPPRRRLNDRIAPQL